MLLTIPLVAVEMGFLLRWPHLGGAEAEDHRGKGTQVRGDECSVPLGLRQEEAGSREASPERAKWREGHTSSAAILAHAVCILSCLLAWCISGLRAERHWARDMPTVELCLESYAGRGGGGGGRGGRSIGVSLWHCVPSLLSMAWVDLSEPCWGLLAAMVLLGHYAGLRLISLRPDYEHVCPERAQSLSLEEKKDKERNPYMGTHGQTPTDSMGLENAEVSLEEEKEQDHMTNADIRVEMQTRPTLCAVVNPSGGASTQSLSVDTETTAGKCHVLGTGVPHSAERHQALCPHGKCCLSSAGFASLPDRCGSLVEAERAVRQMEDKQPPTSRQHPLRQGRGMAENICFEGKSPPQTDCGGVWVEPQKQLPWPRRCCRRWAFPRGSPCPRSLVIAALVWGIFICLFPVPVGFCVLVIQHTETLVLFGLKVLWKIKSHDKQTESTRTEFVGL